MGCNTVTEQKTTITRRRAPLLILANIQMWYLAVCLIARLFRITSQGRCGRGGIGSLHAEMTEKSTFCSTLYQGRGKKEKKKVKSSSLANTFDHDCSYATLGGHYPMELNVIVYVHFFSYPSYRSYCNDLSS